LKYRAGFLEGKAHLLEQILQNNDSFFLKEDLEEGWYCYGYHDGFSFYLNRYFSLKKVDEFFYDRGVIEKILKECFSKRVLKFNQEHQSEISIGTFRL